MVIKLILYVIIFYAISRFIRGLFLPSAARNNQQFNPFKGQGKPGGKNFDQIEDADYEDLSDKN